MAAPTVSSYGCYVNPRAGAGRRASRCNIGIKRLPSLWRQSTKTVSGKPGAVQDAYRSCRRLALGLSPEEEARCSGMC